MRILVVEDDKAVASFVRKGLESEQYAVDVTGNGEDAQSLFGEADFDLVILDLVLPKIDGLEVLKHIRRRKPSPPVLILSGRARVEDRVKGLDLGRTITSPSRSRLASFPHEFGPYLDDLRILLVSCCESSS